MAYVKSRTGFADTAEGKAIRHKLESMDSNVLYNTEPGYSADSMLYPDNLIPFVDKHMNYLVTHPRLDPEKYLDNIRLMTRVR